MEEACEAMKVGNKVWSKDAACNPRIGWQQEFWVETSNRQATQVAAKGLEGGGLAESNIQQDRIEEVSYCDSPNWEGARCSRLGLGT